MLIDMSKLSSEVRSVLAQDMTSRWGTPSLTAYTPSSFQDTLNGVASDGSAQTGNTAADAANAAEAANTANLLMQAVGAMQSSKVSGDDVGKIQMAIGTVDGMAGLVEDPVSADTLAKDMTAPHLVLVRMMKNDLNQEAPVQVDGGLWMPASAAQAYKAANAITPQIQSLYASDQAAGKSGAQTITDILQMELSQPQSYWDAQDPNHLGGDQKQIAQIELALLKQDAAKNGTSA